MSLTNLKTVIVGGHGKIALRLAHLLAGKHRVTSIIRSPSQADDITAASATPLVLSLEDAPASEFTSAFQDADVVVWSAGAGGKGGPERTKAVDYEGAVKVFDAIEAVQGKKPRLILVSAVDVRDTSKVPPHYNEKDLEKSAATWKSIGTYMHWKYEADKNLVARTAFPWTIVRPPALLDTPGTGKATAGVTHITEPLSREDVASALAVLVERPDAAGLVLDVVGGDTPIAEALDGAIKRRDNAWIG